MTSAPILEVDCISKSYAGRKAVDQVSFSIEAGVVFGLLGPNGAGKTSILEMIEGIRRPDGGSIRVAGIDAHARPMAIKQLVGAQLQNTALQDEIKVGEAFRLFSSFYKKPRSAAELIALVGLENKRDYLFKSLSGGDRQRLALGLALVGDPLLILLDEPTVGLDADVRLALHELIRNCRAERKAILLTTHYIEEAGKLCDRIGILQGGVLSDISSPADLIKAHTKGDVVRVIFAHPPPLPALASLDGVAVAATDKDWHVLQGLDVARILSSIARYASASSNSIMTIRTEQASLEDAYLSITRPREKVT
jgi:ABC-2 type transport system ATP-binding protein